MALIKVVFNTNNRIEFKNGTNGTSLIYLNEEVYPPTVTTNTLTYSNGITASGGGNVTSAGTGTVSARGVCWSISTSTPTIDNSHTTNGSGVGTFTSTLTGLTCGMLHYVRAYATSQYGTSYGSTETVTPVDPTVSTSFDIFHTITDLSANTYTNGSYGWSLSDASTVCSLYSSGQYLNGSVQLTVKLTDTLAVNHYIYNGAGSSYCIYHVTGYFVTYPTTYILNVVDGLITSMDVCPPPTTTTTTTESTLTYPWYQVFTYINGSCSGTPYSYTMPGLEQSLSACYSLNTCGFDSFEGFKVRAKYFTVGDQLYDYFNNGVKYTSATDYGYYLITDSGITNSYVINFNSGGTILSLTSDCPAPTTTTTTTPAPTTTTTTTATPTTTTTTTLGAGYYDCGYGCQYYSYYPGCTPCTTYYYSAQQYACSGCTAIGGVVNITDSRSDLNLNKYYADSIGGNNWKIIATGASSGGQVTNLIGIGAGNCSDLACI